MTNLAQLTIDSTIGDLPLDHFQLEPAVLGRDVADRFEQETNLSGVLLIEGTILVGMISRQRFLEQVSRHLGRELYLKRPIQVMLESIASAPLRLPASCEINEAVNLALDRANEAVNDPIVVGFADGRLRLLDIRVLLRAQSHLATLMTRMMRQQKHRLQQYLVQLKDEQAKVQATNKLLEAQQLSIGDRNQLLEQQQFDLLQKSEEIASLNQKFIRISQVLSVEGKKAFQATFDSVDSISHNTDMMIQLGRALVGEVETIQGTSEVIKDVSKRARFLALQAAVLANQATGVEGVSRVTSDISRLSSQTLEAGQIMDDTASHLKVRIQDLTRLARNGASVARSLLEKVVKADIALTDLDDLVQQQDAERQAELSLAQELRQRLERSGNALSELEKMSDRKVLSIPDSLLNVKSEE